MIFWPEHAEHIGIVFICKIKYLSLFLTCLCVSSCSIDKTCKKTTHCSFLLIKLKNKTKQNKKQNKTKKKTKNKNASSIAVFECTTGNILNNFLNLSVFSKRWNYTQHHKIQHVSCTITKCSWINTSKKYWPTLTCFENLTLSKHI